MVAVRADDWDPNERDIRAALTAGIAPRERIWFDEWADRYLFIRKNGRLIRWDTNKVPYWREPMRVLSPMDPTEEVVIMKPSQVAFSTMCNGYCAYRIDVSPGTIVFALPDIGLVENYSKTRMAPMLADCERIRGRMPEWKSRDAGNTIESKIFDGGSLEMRGCNSPAGLSSTPADIVILDEADRAAASAKGSATRSGEGDPYGLLKARLKASAQPKALLGGSPGEKDTSRTEPAYLASDQRLYYVPCPLCAEIIDLRFDRMVWPETEGHQPLYRCQACDDLFDDSGKAELLLAGRWVPKYPGRRVAGFRLNGLYSPFDGGRWEVIDAERREALAARTTNKLIVYVNTTKGETYDSRKAAKVDSTKLDKLVMDVARDDRGAPVIPLGVGVIGIGTDTQGNRLEAVLHGWGRGEEWWHIDRRVFTGDPSVLGKGSVWDELHAYLSEVFTRADGRPMRVTFTAIDYRGAHSATVAEFVRAPRMAVRRVWAVAGSSTPGRKLWPKEPSKSMHAGTEIYTVGINAAKAQIYARLRASVEAAEAIEAAQAKRMSVAPLGGPGIVHIARHIVEEFPEYLAGLTSEVPVVKRGEVHFEHPPDAPRNEPLDCAVYAFCAFRGWKRTVSFGRLDAASMSAGSTAPSPPPRIMGELPKVARHPEIQISPSAPRAPSPAQPLRKVPRYL